MSKQDFEGSFTGGMASYHPDPSTTFSISSNSEFVIHAIWGVDLASLDVVGKT